MTVRVSTLSLVMSSAFVSPWIYITQGVIASRSIDGAPGATVSTVTAYLRRI